MSEHGKDDKATKLMEELFFSYILLKAKDFWIFLYDWLKKCDTYINSITIIQRAEL